MVVLKDDNFALALDFLLFIRTIGTVTRGKCISKRRQSVEVEVLMAVAKFGFGLPVKTKLPEFESPLLGGLVCMNTNDSSLALLVVFDGLFGGEETLASPWSHIDDVRDVFLFRGLLDDVSDLFSFLLEQKCMLLWSCSLRLVRFFEGGSPFAFSKPIFLSDSFDGVARGEVVVVAVKVEGVVVTVGHRSSAARFLAETVANPLFFLVMVIDKEAGIFVVVPRALVGPLFVDIHPEGSEFGKHVVVS